MRLAAMEHYRDEGWCGVCVVGKAGVRESITMCAANTLFHTRIRSRRKWSDFVLLLLTIDCEVS